MDLLISVFDALVQWLGHGFSGFSGWGIVPYTLITTHITIAAVTVFLHRAQAHRALDLHGIPSHFFRFWLWIGSGMVTKEWGAHPPPPQPHTRQSKKTTQHTHRRAC